MTGSMSRRIQRRKTRKRGRDRVTVVGNFVLHPELASVTSATGEAKKVPDSSLSCHSRREIRCRMSALKNQYYGLELYG